MSDYRAIVLFLIFGLVLDGGGDCEDSSILKATLLSNLNRDIALGIIEHISVPLLEYQAVKGYMVPILVIHFIWSGWLAGFEDVLVCP